MNKFTDQLFINKFQPINFADFEINDNIMDILKTLIVMNNLNILFIGGIGYGKTSLLNAVIKEYYGSNCSNENIFRRRSCFLFRIELM